jgi:hypothetical protein
MSVAAAQPALSPETAFPEPMDDGVGRRGLVLSAALHLLLGVLLIFGLPTLFHPPTPEEMPIAVELVTMGPETRATHPNPNMPQREATPAAAAGPAGGKAGAHADPAQALPTTLGRRSAAGAARSRPAGS